MKREEKVAIVGGGLSGIISIGTLKEEGFEPVCFEKTEVVGGNWYYREKSEVGRSSIMPTTIINHSKEMGAFSNFPPKKEYSNFMRHTEVYQYIRDYVEAKDVQKHIRTNCEVTAVRRSEDYDQTGRWKVTVRNTVSGEVFSDIFDRVIIAVGQFGYPKTPTYQGQDDFKGQIMHTHNLKGVQSFEGKNVLVVGMGCSGLDAAVDISRVSKQVYLSTRTGGIIVSRVGPFGYPTDYYLYRRYLTILLDIFPPKFVSWLAELLVLDPAFNQKFYPVQPKYHVLGRDPLVNDHFASRLLSGAVKMKKEVISFTETGVVFEGGEEVSMDAVVMATGYHWNNFRFLDDIIQLRDEESGRINLYKCMWPVHNQHPTLAVIGLLLPLGSLFPLMELQCRFVAQVFAGKKKLPSEKDKLKEVKRRHEINSARFSPNDLMTIRVDYVQYMDEIAAEIGCKPNLLKYLFRDPALFWKLIFGPSVAYQYRLEGPHAWKGAREAIFTVEERFHFPLSSASLN